MTSVSGLRCDLTLPQTSSARPWGPWAQQSPGNISSPPVSSLRTSEDAQETRLPSHVLGGSPRRCVAPNTGQDWGLRGCLLATRPRIMILLRFCTRRTHRAAPGQPRASLGGELGLVPGGVQGRGGAGTRPREGEPDPSPWGGETPWLLLAVHSRQRSSISPGRRQSTWTQSRGRRSSY